MLPDLQRAMNLGWEMIFEWHHGVIGQATHMENCHIFTEESLIRLV